MMKIVLGRGLPFGLCLYHCHPSLDLFLLDLEA
jgi:hypothetical protein